MESGVSTKDKGLVMIYMKEGKLTKSIEKQAGLEVPHSRFKKGLSAKK